MNFYEDIIELIEDVPEEVQRRFGLLNDWERQAQEYKKDAAKLATRLNNDDTLRDEEKANLFRQIGEKLDCARDIAEKKYNLAVKTHKLFSRMDLYVNDKTYHCKLELDVDAPGTSLPIENNFIVERMMTNTAANNNRFASPIGGEFLRPPPEGKQQQQQQRAMLRDFSSSMSRESTPYDRGGGRGAYEKRTRDSSMSSSRASSLAPSSAYDVPISGRQLTKELQKEQRKRKRDRERERQLQRSQQQLQQPAVASGGPPPVLTNPLSAYMRKKKEREREQRKLREVREASEERRRRNGGGGSGSRSPHPSTLTASAAAAAAAGGRLDDVRRAAYVHANRDRNSQQRVIKPEPYDDGYEMQQLQQQPAPQPVGRPRGRPPGQSKSHASRSAVNALLAAATAQQQQQLQQQAPQPRREEQQQLQPERREEEADTFTGGMSDMEDEDLLKFLNDEMPDGIADHDDLNLGLDDENGLFDMASFGADLGKELENIQQQGRPPSPLGQNYYGTLNAPNKLSAAGPSRYSNSNPTKADLKRQQSQPVIEYVSAFGAGESLHGRQRKLTHRAEIHAIEQGHKVQMRKRKEEELALGDYSRSSRSRDVSMAGDSIGDPWEVDWDDQAEDTALYCYCNSASDGTMVGCEGKNCKFGGWFHLKCLHMAAPPACEKWYCYSCSKQR